MAVNGDISFGLSIGAGQSVRRNAGDTAFEAYTPSGGSFSWGASASAGSGIGITLTSADLSGANAFQSSVHTASGTLTACTTTQNTYSTSRTYTLTSGSVTDNFIGTLFSRTNVTTGAGGTLLAQGPVVNITGTDTQTAGTLTPSYDLLKLQPSLRSTGSSINVTVADSVVTAPTNGHIYAVIGNTQTVAQTLINLDTGTSALDNIGLKVKHLKNSGNFIAGGIVVNSFSLSTQALGHVTGLVYGANFNTNSSFDSIGINLYNNTNAGSGVNTGLSITNNSTEFTANFYRSGAGLTINQAGVGGTSLSIYTADNVNTSTNGLVNYTLSNTQSGATVMQKTDLGTSAQGHTGLLVSMANASTSIRGINLDYAGTGTGTGMYMSATGPATSNLSVGISMNSANLSRFFVADWGTNSVSLAARSISFLNMTVSRTEQRTSGTTADSYDFGYLKRTSVMNGSGGTLTATGSVLKLENVATQTAGTLTDTVNVLNVVQSVTSAGHGVSVTGSGTSATNAYDCNMTTGFSGDLFHGKVNSVDMFRVVNDGSVICASSIKTGAPNTGTSGSWKLGSLVTGQVGLVVVSTQYVEIDIGGTLYKLATV